MLKGSVISRELVSRSDCAQMLAILEQCFDNIDKQHFLADLKKKDQVIFLRDGGGIIRGFSTLVSFRHSFAEKEYRVVFSGDTVIAPGHWGGIELPLVWGSHLMEMYQREPKIPLLWLLISKGIRTFKFLPVFFNQYYPCPDRSVPNAVQQLMHSLGTLRFAEQYDSQRGLVLPCSQSYYLREEFAAVQPPVEGRDYIQHFYQKNPLYRRGAELLCLTEFSPENLKPFIRRGIERRLIREGADRHAA